MTAPAPAASPLRPFVGPGRVLARPGASAALGAELAAAAASDGGRVLVIADSALASLGLLATPLEALADAGFEAIQGPGVDSEPTPAAVENAVKAVEGQEIAAVIG